MKRRRRLHSPYAFLIVPLVGMWPKNIIDFKKWLNPSTAPGVSRSNTFLLLLIIIIIIKALFCFPGKLLMRRGGAPRLLGEEHRHS
jgi:hypothetical protein